MGYFARLKNVTGRFCLRNQELLEWSTWPRIAKMIMQIDDATRATLERHDAPRRIFIWVAGGRSHEGRARRTAIALWLRERIANEQHRDRWPDYWELRHFAELNAAECERLRARGQAYSWSAVKNILDRAPFPTERPPARRARRLTKGWMSIEGELVGLLQEVREWKDTTQAGPRRRKKRT